MKRIIYIILIICSTVSAQDKYLTRVGTVQFKASIASFEKVEAINNSVSAILNIKNGEFVALALIKGFRFKNALMEEHFNESYAESDQYPKAIFKGKIQDFNFENININQKKFNLGGKLSFHGKTKTLEALILTIKQSNDIIFISGEFIADASDFDIKIPKIVRNKVSKDVKVSFEFKLQKR